MYRLSIKLQCYYTIIIDTLNTYKNYYYERLNVDDINFVAQYTGKAISTDGELLEIPNLPSSLNDQILTITLQLEELKPEMVPEYPGSGVVSYNYLVNGNVCVSDLISPYVYRNSALMVFYQSFYKRYNYDIEGLSNEANSKGIFQLTTINNKTYLKIKENIAYSSVYNYFVKNVNYKYFMTLNQRLQPVT